jgi:hypothetical protein
MVSNAHLDCFEIIASKLKDSGLNWALSGSFSLYLKGIDIPINDIDIITTIEDIKVFQEIFKDYVVNPVKSVVKEIFSSYVLILSINSIEVEIIADYTKLTSDNKITYVDANNLSTKEYISFNDFKIPIINLKQQLHSYTLLNRLDKVKLITDFLGNE